MAGASLFALLDDISVMTKVAATKTAGVLGDDLALNAHQVNGFSADRELPVVWAVMKGSFLNKAILCPAALALSFFIPWAIMPLLMLGGAYLCFEGVEKLVEPLLHPHEQEEAEAKLADAVPNENIDLVEYENEQIKGAIRTDFVLSAEIIAIALSTLQQASFLQQVVVMVCIAIAMTIGVYGLVACIVKLDDLGFYIGRSQSSMLKCIGDGLVRVVSPMMGMLSVVGTIAMFMVGGGILTHGLPEVHHVFTEWSTVVPVLPVVGTLGQGAAQLSLDMLFGVLVGAFVVGMSLLYTKVLKPVKHATT